MLPLNPRAEVWENSFMPNNPDHTAITSGQTLPRVAFTMRETAQILGISYISVHRLVKRGLLRSSNALRTKIISAKEIERFANSNN